MGNKITNTLTPGKPTSLKEAPQVISPDAMMPPYQEPSSQEPTAPAVVHDPVVPVSFDPLIGYPIAQQSDSPAPDYPPPPPPDEYESDSGSDADDRLKVYDNPIPIARMYPVLDEEMISYKANMPVVPSIAIRHNLNMTDSEALFKKVAEEKPYLGKIFNVLSSKRMGLEEALQTAARVFLGDATVVIFPSVIAGGIYMSGMRDHIIQKMGAVDPEELAAKLESTRAAAGIDTNTYPWGHNEGSGWAILYLMESVYRVRDEPDNCRLTVVRIDHETSTKYKTSMLHEQGKSSVSSQDINDCIAELDRVGSVIYVTNAQDPEEALKKRLHESTVMKHNIDRKIIAVAKVDGESILTGNQGLMKMFGAKGHGSYVSTDGQSKLESDVLTMVVQIVSELYHACVSNSDKMIGPDHRHYNHSSETTHEDSVSAKRSNALQKSFEMILDAAAMSGDSRGETREITGFMTRKFHSFYSGVKVRPGYHEDVMMKNRVNSRMPHVRFFSD